MSEIITNIFTDNAYIFAAEATVVPAVGAPVNPLGSTCDDFAIVSGLDLTSIFLPAGSVANAVDYTVDFRLFAAPDSGALVCDGSTEQPAACAGYADFRPSAAAASDDPGGDGWGAGGAPLGSGARFER